MFSDLNNRSEAVFRYIVDSYMKSGAPVGSRTISKALDLNLSPATIRNVMADLEAEGLLHAPHISAGRVPTHQGLRLYIDGLMQVGEISQTDRDHIESQCSAEGDSINQVMARASSMISGLSEAAGLVVAPKVNKPVKQIQFVKLDPARILTILVMQDGLVENRLMEVEADIPQNALVMAANYLNEQLSGRTLGEAQSVINKDISENKTQLDQLTQSLVQKGIALAPNDSDSHIIIRGQSRLLNDIRALEDLEHVRTLLEALEEQQAILELIETAQHSDGVQIFIGAENKFFEHTGWSMVISPYKSQENNIVGAIGVIGPTRLNYSRVIPLLDYTSKVMQRLIGS
jgi:heat-inducible transcriptional repressor